MDPSGFCSVLMPDATCAGLTVKRGLSSDTLLERVGSAGERHLSRCC